MVRDGLNERMSFRLGTLDWRQAMSSDDISTPSKSYFKESCIGSWLVTVMPLRVGRGNGVWPFGILIPTGVPTKLRGLSLQLQTKVG